MPDKRRPRRTPRPRLPGAAGTSDAGAGPPSASAQPAAQSKRRPPGRPQRRQPRREARPPTPDPQPLAPGEEVTHLVIGRIIGPWGIKGDVRVFVETDFPERFGRTRQVLLGDELTPYRVERGRPHGRVALLKLEGIDTPEAAETLRGQA